MKISFNHIAREAKRRTAWTFIPSPWKFLESIEDLETKWNLEIDVGSQQVDNLLLFSRCHVQLFVTPWTVARQAPLSMGFPRQGVVAISVSRGSS